MHRTHMGARSIGALVSCLFFAAMANVRAAETPTLATFMRSSLKRLRGGLKFQGAALMPLVLFATSAQTAGPEPVAGPLPTYHAEQQVSGVIRTWGHGNRKGGYVGPLVHSWEAGFRKYQPGITFDTSLRGDKSAIGGLYTGAADVALMERGLSAIEKDGYEQVLGRTDPFEISVATGSLDVRNHAMALVIFVNKDNPLAKLTFTQADAIFDADHKRGPKSIRTWGDLGLTGEWADKPIDAYISAIEQDDSQYFQKTVMNGSQKWTGNLREFNDLQKPDGSVVEAGQQIIDALAKDRYGIAIAHMPNLNRQVKPLALAANDDGPYYEATRETLTLHTYPLTRTVSIYVNREPGKPIEPKVKEYLAYILSKEGQEAIARDGGYLPLTPDMAQRQRSKLQ